MARDVLLGVVIGAHGLKGEVKVKTFTEAPDRLGAYGPLHARDGRIFTVVSARGLKPDQAALSLKEVTDRDNAEALTGTELFVARDALPDTASEEFYHADLIGLHAEDEVGRAIGTVRAIHNYGAGDVLEIERDDGDHVLLPFSREFAPTVDVKAGRIVIALPEDDEDRTGKGYVE